MRFRWNLRTALVVIAVISALMAMVVRDLRRSREIQPSDIIGVEVPSADPDRPIAGPRLVRSDGTIRLGDYGDVDVAGRTTRELRAIIAAHLRQHPAAGSRFADLDAGGISIQVFKKNSARGVYAKMMRDVFHSPDYGPG